MRGSRWLRISLLMCTSFACDEASRDAERRPPPPVHEHRSSTDSLPSETHRTPVAGSVSHGAMDLGEVLLTRPFHLSQGDDQAFDVPVSSCDSIVVSVFTVNGRVELGLTDPRGGDLDRKSEAVVRSIDGADESGRAESWHVMPVIPGYWRVRLEAPREPGLGFVVVTEYGGPCVELSTDAVVPPGGDQHLTASVTFDGRPALGLSVVARALRVARELSRAPLTDDGSGADETAGDGVYSGAVHVGDREGDRFIEVAISGTLPDGRVIERLTERPFEVATEPDVTFAEPGIVIGPLDASGNHPVTAKITNVGDGPAELVSVRFYDDVSGRPLGGVQESDLLPGEQRIVSQRLPHRAHHADSASVCARVAVISRTELNTTNNARCAVVRF